MTVALARPGTARHPKPIRLMIVDDSTVARAVLSRMVESDGGFETDAEDWLRTQAAAVYDALKADPSRAIPAQEVRARFEAKWAARS